MQDEQHKQVRANERGSALVYILIAIALLAALTISFMNPSSNQTTTGIKISITRAQRVVMAAHEGNNAAIAARISQYALLNGRADEFDL